MSSTEQPRRPRRPPARLGSLRDPNRVRQQRQPARPSARSTCPNESCTDAQIESTGDTLVCVSCGTVIEDSMIQAEVSFGETSAGAAVVQGGFVGEGQRYARSMGSAFRRVGGTESREVTENQGREEIHKQGNALRMAEHLREKAFRIYRLCTDNNFIQGRRIRLVAAACLYIANRQSKDHNNLLMVDFAENIEVSVYKLGETYRDLKSVVLIKDDEAGFDNSREAENIRQVQPERFIERFVRRLDFGNDWIKVADDACRILKRMDRDWMVTGRSPAGLCGACIILAARMNNFRRSVREVVYVVRVCDVTIAKRLEEFKHTKASNLSVTQFREFGVRLKDTALPPAVYKAQEREERKKRKLRELLGEEADEIEEVATDARSRSPTGSNRGGSPERRVDADGFAIPRVPESRWISAKEMKWQQKNPIPEITPEELEEEQSLAAEMNKVLDTYSAADIEKAFTTSEPVSREIAQAQRELDRKKAEGKAVPGWDNCSRITSVSSAVEIGEDEFADDPEVAICLLTPEESEAKERIWITHNEDWLRVSQAKLLKETLNKESGKTTAKGGQARGRKKKGKQGEKEDHRPPPRSAGEANARMNEEKGRRPYGYTKGINFENLDKIWGSFKPSGTDTESGAESRTTSAAPSRAVSVTPSEQEEEAVEPQQLPTPEPTQDAAAPKAAAAGDDEHAGRDAAGDARAEARGEPMTKKPPQSEVFEEDEGDDGEDDDDDDDDDDEGDDDRLAAMTAMGLEAEYYDEDDDAVGFDDDEGDDY